MSNILTNNINARSGNTITIGGVNDKVSIAGTLTYEDVSSVDSVGVITARSGIHVTGGSVGIGTDNPSTPLHVLGADPQIRIQDSENGNYAQILLDGPNSNLNFDWGSGAQRNINLLNSGAGAIRVGVATDDPSTDLHVFGSTDVSTLIDAAAGDGLLSLRNAGDGNYSGINFTRERSSGTNVTGGSIWMPSITSNNEATLFIQTQSASAGAGVSSTLSNNNGVRLKLTSQPNGVAANSAFIVEIGAERMRVDNSGNLLIGREAAGNTGNGHSLRGGDGCIFSRDANGETLQVSRNSNNGKLIEFRTGDSGNATAIGNIAKDSGSSVAYNTSESDRRVKKNIEPWTDEILQHFKTLQPKKFHFNIQSDADPLETGYIAQDLVDAFPEAYPSVLNEVDGEEVYRYCFNPSGMVKYLMKALQEEIVKREALEARISALEAN